MAECLALELLLAFRKEGSARQKRELIWTYGVGEGEGDGAGACFSCAKVVECLTFKVLLAF
jgi:hypothetical protein